MTDCGARNLSAVCRSRLAASGDCPCEPQEPVTMPGDVPLCAECAKEMRAARPLAERYSVSLVVVTYAWWLLLRRDETWT